MALFKSQVISVASGSVGGLTYSRNRFGMYLRNRSLPVNPASSFQVAIRNAMASLTTRWVETLTQAQRDAWEVYASNVSVLNKVGDVVFLTGLNMYVRSNVQRQVHGLGLIDAAPTTFDLGTMSPITATTDAAADDVDIAFDNTDGWAIATGGYLLVYASRPQNSTINFFAGPYRFAGLVIGAATPPTSPATMTLPFPIASGNRVFFKANALYPDGRRTSDFRTDDVAT